MKRLSVLTVLAVSVLALGLAPLVQAGTKRGKGQTKVAVCHVPPGNPSNAHVIVVGPPALRAHLAHGDCLAQAGAKRGDRCSCSID